METNKPIEKIRHKEDKLISASIFQNEFGKSIVLQLSYRKDNVLEQKQLTILAKRLDVVIEVLKECKSFLNANPGQPLIVLSCFNCKERTVNEKYCDDCMKEVLDGDDANLPSRFYEKR
ncbi:MAG: hypothetical protein Q8R00_00245 [Candidatus Nanoarchaeia archaeon]|nr:hypothetical protein [Candidatus Nanoarchaeia archaeon]